MTFLKTSFVLGSLALLGVVGAQDAAPSLKPVYVLKTTKGDIKLELDAEKAPATALNFDQYAADNFYDGTIFHRVIKDFMIQGGGFTADGQRKADGLREPIANEWTNGLKNDRGTIAMARIGRRPDSATSQFFINVVDNQMLNQPNDGAGYCVFGKVTEGMEAADAIATATVGADPLTGASSFPTESITITDVAVEVPLDRALAAEKAAKFKEEAEKAAMEAKIASQKAAMAEVESFVAAKEKELGRTREVTDSGLVSIIMKEGTGSRTPTVSDSASVHYTGTFLNGEEFDSSRRPGRQPFDVSLSGGVIQGWLEGLKLMKEGERRLFIIPPALGYGEAGMGPIPGNTWLVFDVEMLKIK